VDTKPWRIGTRRARQPALGTGRTGSSGFSEVAQSGLVWFVVGMALSAWIVWPLPTSGK
jgi:hypothetical protein